MAKLTAAIIGCGWQGRYHLSALRAMEEIDLMAACDASPDMLAKRADEFGVPRARRFTDMRAMLEEARPEIVVIATHARHHCEAVLACAEARVKGILCEKPMALDLVECDRMIEACRQSGSRLAINHQVRCSPTTEVAQKLLAGGEIGALTLVRGLNKGRRRGGNELVEQGSHTADRLCCFAGRPTWCSAYIAVGRRPAEVGDTMTSKEMDPGERDVGLVVGERVFAQFGFTGCEMGEMYCMGWEAGSDDGVDLIGTRGQIYTTGRVIDRAVWVGTPPSLRGGGGMTNWKTVEAPLTRSWVALDQLICVMHDHLIRAIHTDREHPSNGEAGRQALEMIMAVYESHRRGCRVAMPLADRRHPLVRWREEER